MDNLKENILHEIAAIPPDILADTLKNMECRVKCVRQKTEITSSITCNAVDYTYIKVCSVFFLVQIASF